MTTSSKWVSRILSYFGWSDRRDTEDQPLMPLPPPYNASGHARQIDTNSTRGPKDWRELKPNIYFIYVADNKNMTSKRDHGGPWMAKLEVQAADPISLMRDGFYWSQDNVKWEEGYLIDVAKDIRQKGYKFGRRYNLVDNSYATQLASSGAKSMPAAKKLKQKQKWTAQLYFFAQTPGVLARCRLADITVDRVLETKVYNWDRKAIYLYQSWNPAENINTVFDDEMVLEGAWPWPKASKASEGEGGDIQNA